jgi:hypothetical protein
MFRRGLLIAALAAALNAVPAIEPAMADTKKNNQEQGTKPPKITPSTAAQRAQQMHPGSTVLDVKDAGNKYIVTLKTPGELKRVAIPVSP